MIKQNKFLCGRRINEKRRKITLLQRLSYLLRHFCQSKEWQLEWSINVVLVAVVLLHLCVCVSVCVGGDASWQLRGEVEVRTPHRGRCRHLGEVCAMPPNVFTNGQVCEPPGSLQPMMRTITCLFALFSPFTPSLQRGRGERAWRITVGLLPDVHVRSGLISALVCQLGPKGQKRRRHKRHLYLTPRCSLRRSCCLNTSCIVRFPAACLRWIEEPCNPMRIHVSVGQTDTGPALYS